MSRVASSSIVLVCTLLASSPTVWAQGSFTSPEVHPDRRVTVRIHAPEARVVRLTGSLVGKPTDLEKKEGGVWEVTVGPLEPDIYSYMLSIDGASVTDPRNPDVKVWRVLNSLVEVPGDPPSVHQLRDVPHGSVHRHWYRSKSLGVTRSLVVYTPPGYDPHREDGYPVVYLLHGSGDNEEAWTDVGKAHRIADNLIADGKLEPVVIAMPYGHPPVTGAGREARSADTIQRFEEDLLGDVLPFMERAYRVGATAQKRAVVGLSMGGGQSLGIGLANPDTFHWIGAFSAAPPPGDWGSRFAKAVDRPKELNESIQLLWVAVGKDDFLLERNETFHEWLRDKGLEHSYQITEGGHDWQVWRRYLAELLPLLFQKETGS